MTTLIISSIIALLVIAGLLWAATRIGKWIHAQSRSKRFPGFHESECIVAWDIEKGDHPKAVWSSSPTTVTINLDEVRRLLKESGAGPTQLFYNGRPMTWADVEEMKEQRRVQFEWLKSERDDEEKGGNQLIEEAKDILNK